MAAARQKEMNVSITEDATMSRTRLDGGATVVRVDAIVRLPSRETGALDSRERIRRPPCAEFMSKLKQCQSSWTGLSRTQKHPALVLSEQLFAIFNEADEHHHG